MFFPEFKEFGLPELLTVIAVVGFVLVVVNYFINYLPLGFLKPNTLISNDEFEPISVIICAKNEDENLTEFLPKVLTQDYPDFEVIVVNDCSWDNTENVIDEFAKIFPNLRKTNIKEDKYYKHGKKFAVLVGIKAAKNNLLVFTDADCYPSSDQWLKAMARGFAKPKEVVLGYGAFEKQKSFINRLIRFDAFIIAVNYLSAAIKGKAYMGVGRNLAYTKELFYKQKGFSNHYHINSGDDDLFVNQAANEQNVNVVIDKGAITYSPAKKNMKDWRLQKARHLTTAPLYNSASKTKIVFSYFSLYFFYLSLFLLLIHANTIILFPIILTIKIILQLITLNSVTKKLNERDLLIGSILYELILLIIYPIFHLTKLLNKPNKWTN
jgi:glycosyltransferase involved in cell wall biosynthesis